MPSQDELTARLAAARVVPVLRSPSAAEAVAQSARCAAAGLDVIELTTTTPDWPLAFAEVRASFPGRLLGVGTVLTPQDAVTAMDCGASFLVSPCPVPAVRAVAADRVPLIEGGMTTSEVLAAAAHGIAKVFPAHVGGPQFLRSMIAISPAARLVPTGGIALADVGAWLAAGALAVGVGAGLLAEPDLTLSVQRLIKGANS